MAVGGARLRLAERVCNTSFPPEPLESRVQIESESSTLCTKHHTFDLILAIVRNVQFKALIPNVFTLLPYFENTADDYDACCMPSHRDHPCRHSHRPEGDWVYHLSW